MVDFNCLEGVVHSLNTERGVGSVCLFARKRNVSMAVTA